MTLNSIKDESKWNFQVFQKVRVPKRKERIRAHRIFSLRKTMQKWERRGTSIESSSINGRSTVDQSKVGFDYWRFVFVLFFLFFLGGHCRHVLGTQKSIHRSKSTQSPSLLPKRKKNKQTKEDRQLPSFFLPSFDHDRNRSPAAVLPSFTEVSPATPTIPLDLYVPI